MLLDPSDYAQATMLFGIFGYEVRSVIERLLQPGDTFIDIGAQLGYFSFLASNLVGPHGTVHAFEPDPAAHRRLVEAAAVNSAMNNLQLNASAVGEADGSLDFYLSSTTGWSSRLNVREANVRERVKVPMVHIDGYLRQRGIDIAAIRMVKMDIEGGEPWALHGMRELLSHGAAPFIVAEYAPTRLQHASAPVQNIRVILSDHGYRAYILSRKRIPLVRRAVGGFRLAPTELVPVDPFEPLGHCDLLFARGAPPSLS